MFWSDVAHREILAARLNGSQLVKLVNTGITTPGICKWLYIIWFFSNPTLSFKLSFIKAQAHRIRAEIRPYIWKSHQCHTKYDGASLAPAVWSFFSLLHSHIPDCLYDCFATIPVISWKLIVMMSNTYITHCVPCKWVAVSSQESSWMCLIDVAHTKGHTIWLITGLFAKPIGICNDIHSSSQLQVL